MRGVIFGQLAHFSIGKLTGDEFHFHMFTRTTLEGLELIGEINRVLTRQIGNFNIPALAIHCVAGSAKIGSGFGDRQGLRKSR
eukprot:gene10118-10186_t